MNSPTGAVRTLSFFSSRSGSERERKINVKCQPIFSSARLVLLALTVAGFVIGAGCSSTAPRRTGGISTEETAQAEPKGEEQKGGAQLWAEKCSQCHYARDPGAFGPAQWEMIMLHMRVRANLTVKEHRAILEFLRSAN